MVKPAGFQEVGCPHTVDHEHDIIAHKDCGDKKIFVAIKKIYDLTEKATALYIKLDTDTVGGDVGYLCP